MSVSRLSTRVHRLEHSAVASGAVPPWLTPHWQWLSEAAKARERARYLKTRSDSELEDLLTALDAQEQGQLP